MSVDLYGGGVVKPYLGRVVLKKLAGAGPVATGTQIVAPHAAARPRNPSNTVYLTGINSAGYPSGSVAGKRTPSCVITTVVKTSSFFSANLVNSLILAVDGGGNTDVWSILLDDLYQPAIYDGAKCVLFRLQQSARGGAMNLTLGFNAMYGDSENPGTLFTPTVFSSGAGDPGQVTDVTKVSLAGEADLVQGFTLELRRPQSWVNYDDGGLFPAGISSGVLTGTLTLTQGVKFSATWGSSAAINIGQTGAGVSISAALSGIQDVREFQQDSRTVVRSFQLFNPSGAAPISVSAL